jgi:hypothetical protein
MKASILASTNCPGCFDVTLEHPEGKHNKAARGGTYDSWCGSYRSYNVVLDTSTRSETYMLRTVVIL